MATVAIWFLAREEEVASNYYDEREAFYRVLDLLPADRTLAVSDSLLVLPLRYYAPPQIASRIVFPVDFRAIRQYKGEDSPDENLWAGRDDVFPVPVVPLDNLLEQNSNFLVVSTDDNWLLKRLAEDDDTPEELPHLHGYTAHLGIHATVSRPGLVLQEQWRNYPDRLATRTSGSWKRKAMTYQYPSLNDNRRKAIIIGAGPAGLTAAYELLTRSDIVPVVLEKTPFMGGISRTVEYKGNRMDIGGHRFFSKSDRVMDWWLNHLPIEDREAAGKMIDYQRQSRPITMNAPSGNGNAVMLVRERRSRIYFLRKFFAYPIQLTLETLRNLGVIRVLKIGFSYMYSALFPPRRIENLEEFFISRFGGELYRTFFKSYTEKVWGVPCREISAEWGAQRIKGLSITRTIQHILGKIFRKPRDWRQKNTETSLIEKFLYPKFGPGQLWETVAEKVKSMGGVIVAGLSVTKLHLEDRQIVSVTATDDSGNEHVFPGDYFFSTMPVKELVSGLDADVPPNVREVAENLQYRDFITVGLLLRRLTVKDKGAPERLLKDNWIYIQEPEVKAGRLQIFNNWSPYLVRDPETVWIGVEYFCYETDPVWKLPNDEMAKLAARELEQIGMISSSDVLDFTVVHVPKTYPAYFGAYERFDEVRAYLDAMPNLFLVGRNGMHKYNNQDHSMLTAMTAVDNILEGRLDKSNIWAVNTEMEYHEEKSPAVPKKPPQTEPVAV